MVFKPQSDGQSSYNYDFSVDDIKLVPSSVGAPTAATPIPTNVVDSFRGGTNQIEYTGNGNGPGYWFDYCGAGSTVCPTYNQGAGSQPPFYLSAPGDPAVAPVPGAPNFAAEYSGTQADYSGFGFNVSSAASADMSTWTKFIYYTKGGPNAMASGGVSTYTVMMNDPTTNPSGCYGASLNRTSTLTLSAAWTPVTIVYNPSSGSYQLGSVNAVSGTNGCTTNYSAHQLNAAAVVQVQWQPAANGKMDFWIDDIYLAP
jgi:hypothetical protein